MWVECFTCDGFYYPDGPEAAAIQQACLTYSFKQYVRGRLERLDPRRTPTATVATIMRDLAQQVDILDTWELGFIASTARWKQASERQETRLWMIRDKLLDWSMEP